MICIRIEFLLYWNYCYSENTYVRVCSGKSKEEHYSYE